jgi:hypothetical protein
MLANISEHETSPLTATASSFHRLLGGSYQTACFYLFSHCWRLVAGYVKHEHSDESSLCRGDAAFFYKQDNSETITRKK